jgi:hypothetical protein
MTDSDSWTVREHPEFPGELQVHPQFRTDHYPFRDDPRYLDREPEAIAGAIEVAGRSELTLFVDDPLRTDGKTYLGPAVDDIAHSWMRSFWSNASRRCVGIQKELMGQRDRSQTGLDTWGGGRA